MKRWGKIYSLVAITLLLVVIIVLQIYFKQLYGQSIPSPAVRQNIKAVGQEATASDTSNWKTYKDTSLDFELKYPVDFEVLNNPSKFPVVKYNGDMVVLQKQTTYPDGEVDTASVALKKVHTSLKKVIADEFDWSVRSVRFENNKFVIERDANTACYIARDYIIPKEIGDEMNYTGEETGDMLIASVVTPDGCSTTHQTPVVDTIVSTVQFPTK